MDTNIMNTTKLPEHFLVSSCDGGLYDTRKPDWSKEPVRAKYQYAHRKIENFGQLKATLRQKYAWPGGYEIVYLTHDGALLCDKCVRKNIRSIWHDMRAQRGSGWKIVECAIEAVRADCAREVSEELVNYCDQCSREFGELA